MGYLRIESGYNAEADPFGARFQPVPCWSSRLGSQQVPVKEAEQVKRGTPRHPKVYDLLKELDLPIRQRPLVIGYLELLWAFADEFAPQGDIGRYSDERIEAACDWSGRRGKLIEALTKSGWCDKSSRYRLIVHDWHDHATDSVRKKLQRASLSFLSLTEKVTGQCPQPSPETSGVVRTTLPYLTLPNHTSPEPPPKTAPVRVLHLTRSLDEWVTRLYERHPKKKNHALIGAALLNLLEKSDSADALMAEIDRVHALWCQTQDWNEKNARFCPKLDEWIGDQGYTKLPESRAPPKSMYPDMDEWKKDIDFEELRRERERESGTKPAS